MKTIRVSAVEANGQIHALLSPPTAVQKRLLELMGMSHFRDLCLEAGIAVTPTGILVHQEVDDLLARIRQIPNEGYFVRLLSRLDAIQAAAQEILSRDGPPPSEVAPSA
jgi:hypothetical protein